MNLHSSRKDQTAATSVKATGGCVRGRGKHQASGACVSQSHRLEAALDGSRESLEQAVQIGRRSRGRWGGSACASRGLRAHPKLHSWCSPLPLAPSPDAPQQPSTHLLRIPACAPPPPSLRLPKRTLPHHPFKPPALCLQPLRCPLPGHS